MKVHWLALMILLCAMLFAPAATAKIVEEKDGYLVSTAGDTLLLPDMLRFSTSTIAQGESHHYSTWVATGTASFSPYLSWGSLSNSLSLTIRGPGLDLGPYYDSSDGAADGRISLRIYRAGGLAQGTWDSYVYGHRVTGSQAYSYSVGLG